MFLIFFIEKVDFEKKQTQQMTKKRDKKIPRGQRIKLALYVAVMSSNIRQVKQVLII